MNRNNSSDFVSVTEFENITSSVASQAPAAGNIFVFATNLSGTATEINGKHRLMFYTIGTATTLTSIRDRLFTFIDSIRQT